MSYLSDDEYDDEVGGGYYDDYYYSDYYEKPSHTKAKTSTPAARRVGAGRGRRARRTGADENESGAETNDVEMLSDDAHTTGGAEDQYDPEGDETEERGEEDDEADMGDDRQKKIIFYNEEDESSLEMVKDIVIMPPEKRITPSIMSRYEQTECISIRAVQIEKNGKCFVKTSANTPTEMAEQELLMRKTPLRIRRFLGHKNYNGKLYEVYEDWNPNEMQLVAPY